MLQCISNFSSSKRTVDFGLSRGYSGAQEAKHRMAMAIANFAGGPGRRRRSYMDSNKPMRIDLTPTQFLQ